MTYELDGYLFEISAYGEERTAVTSLHALARVMQRCNMNEAQALRLIERAWKNGSCIDTLPFRRQRDYVKSRRILMYNGYSQLRVYQNCLFIFAPTAKLITAYPLPDSFHKRIRFDNNKKVIRHFRKYNRMFPNADSHFKQ